MAMKTIAKAKTGFMILLLAVSVNLAGQGTSYPWFYRVYFRDKGDKSAADFTLEDLVSDKAVVRRAKSGITAPDIRDVPVFSGYISKIKTEGLILHCTSKWMNSALFKSSAPVDINLLLGLPFVSDVKTVKSSASKGSTIDKADPSAGLADLPPYDLPVTMVNGYPLHNSGYNGRGILIAVLDGGFTNANQISSLTGLRARKGIKSTFDFVLKSESVYNYSSHGTNVLSVLAGKLEQQIEGTAQDADYMLLRSEDVSSEFPCEEDFWAAAAEYADSSGADIITSSLGYNTFDDPAMNYKTSDLDGNTAFITRVADIAASKGILVVNSAGNERRKEWQRIMFPADGDSVLAVGAVDGNRIIASFSSAGPSSDRRVKPDVSALGVNVPVQTTGNTTGRSSGTSFSCPIMAGMAACLMQAVPRALNYDIITSLRKSSDKNNEPDSLYGYGIPDMNAALVFLQDIYVIKSEKVIIAAPNPTTGAFELVFQSEPGNFSLEILSAEGKLISRRDYEGIAGRTLLIDELENKVQGIYFVRFISATGSIVLKIIKLRD
jgi:serine protease AprX